MNLSQVRLRNSLYSWCFVDSTLTQVHSICGGSRGQATALSSHQSASFLCRCLAQGPPVTPEHLLGIPGCLALGHTSLEPTVRPCLRAQIQGLTLQWRQFGTHTLAPWNPHPPVPGTRVSSSFHCNQHALYVFWSQLFVALLSLMDSMINTSPRMVAPAHLSPTGGNQQQRQPNPSVSRHQCQDCLWVKAAPQPGIRSPASTSS